MPARRERICGSARGDHGSVCFVPRTGGTRVANRLPVARIPCAETSREGEAGYLQYDGKAQDSDRGLQCAAGGMRGGGAQAVCRVAGDTKSARCEYGTARAESKLTIGHA